MLNVRDVEIDRISSCSISPSGSVDVPMDGLSEWDEDAEALPIPEVNESSREARHRSETKGVARRRWSVSDAKK